MMAAGDGVNCAWKIYQRSCEVVMRTKTAPYHTLFRSGRESSATISSIVVIGQRTTKASLVTTPSCLDSLLKLYSGFDNSLMHTPLIFHITDSAIAHYMRLLPCSDSIPHLSVKH